MLCKFLGFELLGHELTKLVHKGVQNFKYELRKKLIGLAIKAFGWFLILVLVHITLFSAFIALASYLNEVLESSYQGFLITSGGGAIIILLFVLVKALRWRSLRD